VTLCDADPISIVNGDLIEPITDQLTDIAEIESVTIVGGRIGDLPQRGETEPHGSSSGRVIDAEGLSVCPGFVDLQVNGGHGIDLVHDPVSMWQLGSLLPQHGVTGFLPTFISAPDEVYQHAMSAWAERPPDYRGAEPLGLHFEGPMLNPTRLGAHPPGHIKPPDKTVIKGWSRAKGVALVTLAPELEGAEAVVEELISRGVAVSAGHTAATAQDGAFASSKGVRIVTHLFNAMVPLHHRDPGLIGFALATDGIDVGLIVDGIHLSPTIVAIAWRAKGASQILLVTDAVAAMGLGPGRYRFGQFTVVADEHQVQTVDGTLAGSILTMDRAVRNTMSYTGCELAEVLPAATTNPARVLGLADRGRLGSGSVADLVLVDDELNVVMTVCSGSLCYVADEARDRIGPGLGQWADCSAPNS